ncbi:hypothetical protein [Agromyces humi]|uniref:hypothetical protein n=1 Tax=Agromyces humi TaxID=1766800 RepID=UPI0013582480|nr:hypothetical protein [Agromyces humi]
MPGPLHLVSLIAAAAAAFAAALFGLFGVVNAQVAEDQDRVHLREYASDVYAVELSDAQADDLTKESLTKRIRETSVTQDGVRYTVHAVRDADDDYILVLPDGSELPKR